MKKGNESVDGLLDSLLVPALMSASSRPLRWTYPPDMSLPVALNVAPARCGSIPVVGGGFPGALLIVTALCHRSINSSNGTSCYFASLDPVSPHSHGLLLLPCSRRHLSTAFYFVKKLVAGGWFQVPQPLHAWLQPISQLCSFAASVMFG